MSRAFVKEGDAERDAVLSDAEHSRKTAEWIKLQRKKLDILLNDPKSLEMDAAKRERWIASIRRSLEEAGAMDATLRSQEP